MDPVKNWERLLNDHRVIDEINRHLWIESEKAGYDIGFEKAKDDWLKKFSEAWMAYHMPRTTAPSKKKSRKGLARGRKFSRRAKSYVK